MANGYETLSRYYQGIILDDKYNEWTDYLITLINNHLSPCSTGLDVGCGTGIFTRKLKSQGYNVKGVDISEYMLNIAKSETLKQRQNIDYLLGDMRSLKSLEKLDFISSVNDGLNYIPKNGVEKTFKSFNKCLKKCGIVMFDVSTKYKLEKILGENMFGDDGEDLSYIWISEYIKEEEKLNISVSFFEKDGAVYKRYNEEQTEYAHEVEFIIESLKTSGFDIISVTDGFGNEITPTSERALFLAKKR